MRHEFRMPDLGEGVAEGEVVAWLVGEGEQVREDQDLVEVMTDKATVTIGAPYSGRIEKLVASRGSVVPVGQLLLVIASGEGQASVSGSGPSRALRTPEIASTSAFDQIGAPSEQMAKSHRGAPSGPADKLDGGPGVPARATGAGDRRAAPIATPATRRLARQLGIALEEVPATGEEQRVTRDALLAFAQRTDRASTGASGQLSEPLCGEDAGQQVRRIPFVGLRRKIAERMVESRRTAAHFTFVEECDASALVDLRLNMLPEATKQRIHLTYLPFIVKAVSAALRNHPIMNARLDAKRAEIVLNDACHIGIATATRDGLVVPVVRHADRRSLRALATEIDRLGAGARDATLNIEDHRGSTFTVSSLGKRSGLLATPILHAPNVGILSVHKIRKRPVVHEDRIVIGHEMLLALSVDHRVVDGHEGAEFLYEVIRRLEKPTTMLLS